MLDKFFWGKYNSEKAYEDLKGKLCYTSDFKS